MNRLKRPLYRSEGYRRLVAGFSCCFCGVEGYSQAAHANTGKGMSLKSSDLQIFALCGPRYGVPGCHALLDQGALMTKEERRRFEQRCVVVTQGRAIEAGWTFPEDAC